MKTAEAVPAKYKYHDFWFSGRFWYVLETIYLPNRMKQIVGAGESKLDAISDLEVERKKYTNP